MNQIVIYGIIISIILGITTFVASNNYIVAIAVVVIGILYFVILARPMFNKYLVKTKRFRECYHFINTFIVSLSVKGVAQGAYETTVSSMSENFISEIGNIETFSNKEKLEHLNKYFRFHVYSLFIDLINIYEEQGGDILNMSNHLLDETRIIEEYISESITISRKKMFEFAILWALTLGIMIFLRFSLGQFFDVICRQVYYPIGVGGICLFCLISIHIALMRMCKLELKGWNDYEKI